jgi:hypothetical protein
MEDGIKFYNSGVLHVLSFFLLIDLQMEWLTFFKNRLSNSILKAYPKERKVLDVQCCQMQESVHSSVICSLKCWTLSLKSMLEGAEKSNAT